MLLLIYYRYDYDRFLNEKCKNNEEIKKEFIERKYKFFKEKDENKDKDYTEEINEMKILFHDVEVFIFYYNYIYLFTGK